jgi:2-oxo-3-hexenedioate decarboxylase
MVFSRIEECSALLDSAALERREVDMLTLSESGLTIEHAYNVQEQLVARRLSRGEQLVGMKMGLTSRAKMEQVGVHEPIFGRLTDAMRLSDGGTIVMDELIHPKIEPEIAFILGEELSGPVTPAEALRAVAGVCVALEVIDSRFRDFKFTLPDVIADNTSASRFVLGSTLVDARELNLGNLGIIFEVNGVVRETASSAAVLDNPARSLAELANMLARRGETLQSGAIILSGGATAAVELKRGDRVRAIIEDIGSAEAITA